MMVHCDCGVVSFRNCIVVSIAFLLVFSGFNGAQRFATSADEDAEERSISLAIIYTVFTVSTLLVGPIVRRISTHKVFVAATSCYALYIVANIEVIPSVLYISSVLVGIAAPCLWVARGVYITECANQNEIFHHETLNSKLGFFNGIFWCAYQFSACLGSVMGGLLFQVGGTIVYLYVLFGVICIVGVCTFCCIKPMTLDPGQNIQSQAIDIANTEKLISAPSTSDIESTGDHSVDGSESVEATNASITSELIASGYTIAHWFKQFNLWCSLPLFMYYGLQQSFDYAEFPLLILDNSLKFYILGYYGLISMVASYFIGRLSDHVYYLSGCMDIIVFVQRYNR
eukprot:177674_1